MELLERAMEYAHVQRKKHAVIWIILGYCVIMFAVFGQVSQIGQVVTALVFVTLTIITIVLAHLKSRKSHIRLKDSKLYKELEEMGDAEEFLATIDSELNHELRFTYRDSNYHLTMYITKTWLVFISSYGSIIRKLEEVLRIYPSFSPNNSRHYLVIDFKDGSFFTNKCDSDEMIELMKEKVPFISYEEPLDEE